MSHPVPFMKASNVLASTAKKLPQDKPDLEEAIEEEDDAELVEAVEVDEDELDLKTDKYIKVPKKKAAPKKTAKKVTSDDDSAGPKAKKAKAPAAKGRGRPKKA